MGLVLLALVMRRASGALTMAGLAGGLALVLPPLAQLVIARQVATLMSAVVVSSIAVVRQAIAVSADQ